MTHHHTLLDHSPLWFEFVSVLFFSAFIAAYVLAANYSKRNYTPWPVRRTLLWIAGIVCAALAVTGPIAEAAHTDFTAHMLGHLLLGMLSPLLLVLSAPMTLILRTLHVQTARNLTKILRSRPVGFISSPVVASVLNIGGLWVLYRTVLFDFMHEHIIVYLIVHLHVFLAGYLFTAAMIYVDPTPHRYSFIFRTIVFVFALAAHGILSKLLYVQPPASVDAEQAKAGAMLMYYGGDLIDFVLIIVLFYHWYQQTRPRTARMLPQT